MKEVFEMAQKEQEGTQPVNGQVEEAQTEVVVPSLDHALHEENPEGASDGWDMKPFSRP